MPNDHLSSHYRKIVDSINNSSMGREMHRPLFGRESYRTVYSGKGPTHYNSYSNSESSPKPRQLTAAEQAGARARLVAEYKQYQELERLEAEKKNAMDRDYAAHTALIHAAKSSNVIDISTQIAALKPLDRIEESKFLRQMPESEGENVFDSIFLNPLLTLHNKHVLAALLFDKGYNLYYRKLIEPRLLAKVDPFHVFTHYKHDLTQYYSRPAIQNLTETNEHQIWDLLISIKDKDYAKEITATLVEMQRPSSALKFIKKRVDACLSPAEAIAIYQEVSALLAPPVSRLKDFDSLLNKIVKQKILTIELNTKVVGKENKAEEKPAPDKKKVIDFLSKRRPSRFGCFTSTWKSTSKEIFEKINENQLDEAKGSLANSKKQTEKQFDEQIAFQFGR